MTRIQMRRDTSTNWSVNNPTPANGEPCYETDTHKFKIGDGVTKYTNLPYQGDRSSGGGATIDDSTTSTTSTWSSSKINSEITTDIENLKNTKNNNIFDIGKFTVVGSPTITNDGVASGFSANNALSTTQDITYNNSFEIRFPDFILNPYTHDEQNFITVNNSNFVLKAWQSRDLTISLYDGESNIASENVVINLSVNTLYSTKLIWENNTYKFCIKGGIYSDWTETWNFASSKKAIIGGFIGIGTRRDYPNACFEGSIDLKQFSITVDGKEVFNGLMESTKPIYDAIKANNTELSEFKTETSTDFSAVNSALNEKANLTDLALKQNMLVSGTNIKTINGETILGKGDITVGGSTPTNMVTTDTAQDITANKTFYGEIRVGADNNYATLAKFSKEALASGDSTLLEHIDLGEASFVVQGSLGKKVYETDKYVYKKYINVDDLSDNQIAIDNSISSQVAHMAMPSDKYMDLTLGASGTTYTAPADGWFIFRASSTGVAGTFIDTSVFYRNQMISTATYIVSFAGDTCGFVQQAPKGAILSFVYNATFGTISAFRFVYAKGSEPTV